MFTKISTISLPVKNLEVSKAFYDVLGCGVVGNLSIMAGMRWLMQDFPGVETRLVLVTWFPNMPPGSLQGVILITPDYC